MDKKLHEMETEELIDKMSELVDRLDSLINEVNKLKNSNDPDSVIDYIFKRDEYDDLADELDYCQGLLLDRGFTGPKRLMATYL